MVKSANKIKNHIFTNIVVEIVIPTFCSIVLKLLVGAMVTVKKKIDEALLECVKVPMPAHQVLPLTAYIFEASYSTSVTQVNKI